MPIKKLYGLLKSDLNPDGFDEFIIENANDPADSFTGEETMLINTNDESNEVIKALKVKWFKGAKGDTGLPGSVAWGNLTVSGVGAALITATTTAAQRAVLGISNIGSSFISATTVAAQRTLLGLGVPAIHNYGSTINTVAQGNDIRFVPSGAIILWSGSIVNIPTGWYLCNGFNGTPDLCDRFIVGSGNTYSTGSTGGVESVTLTAAQSGIPAHGHTTTTDSHYHNLFGSTANDYDSNLTGIYGSEGQIGIVGNGGGIWGPDNDGSHRQYIMDESHSHTVNDNTAQDASVAHENRPPYYALAYIMKS